MIPDLIRLFHITAIDNLAAICQSDSLVCKNVGADQGIQYHNIAHSGAQGARTSRSVPNPPGGTIHDFVPFYFAPRSPMLLAINYGRVAGCQYRQEDILHFETTVPSVTQNAQSIVFFDRNATYNYSNSYTDIRELGTRISWDLITETPSLDGFCKYFQDVRSDTKYTDRMEKRMAEFLVQQSVPLNCITRIGVINPVKAELVRGVLAQYQVTLPVEVMPIGISLDNNYDN
jgi:hypothetical protein